MSYSEFDEVSLPEDKLIDAGKEAVAKTAELRIRQYLGKDRMPVGRKYLALGVGAAIPELALARSLHIPDNHITLVEKQSFPDILKELRAKYPRINYQYSEGLYHFLQTTHEKYDLVTAFLLHHLFRDSQRMEAFINLLSQKVRPGAIISVLPYVGQYHVWRNNGFEPFPGGDPTSFYTFK